MPKAKWLREFTLSTGSGRSHVSGYRATPNLLEPPPSRVIKYKRGVPIFSQTVDTIKQFATGNRQYKPPNKRTPLVTDFTDANYHEMNAKFQFHVDGVFPGGGEAFEEELFKVAQDLHLVGFMKVRSRYALGHLQGDVFSLSYMRKWLQDRQQTSGRMENVHIFEDSYGIPEFRYTKLECMKDWRSPIRRRQHMDALREDAKWDLLEKQTVASDDRNSSGSDSTHVRTY